MSGGVVWITGLPSSGKSTLAEKVAHRLRSAARSCVVLDGDAVRAALVPAPGYGPEARDAFYATLARLAALKPRTLACMHGSAWRGDGGALLRHLAEALGTAR